MNKVPLGELMPSRVPSLNPANFPNEDFELWSIPAFDRGQPEWLAGSEIGSAKKCVEPEGVKEIEIPLPSLSEQKRIAAILDQADSLRRLRQRANDRLSSLGQAIFNSRRRTWAIGG